MNYKYVIAIDPDVKKSGVCYLSKETKEFELKALTFPQLMLDFLSIKENNKQNITLIRIECSWDEKGINGEGKHNHHTKWHDSKPVASAKGYDTGRNHQTGILIKEMAQNFGFDVELVKPLNKKHFHWTGNDGKASQDDLKKFFPDFPRSNQETRDAFLLAWIYSGFSLDRDRQVLAQILNKK